MAITHAVQSGGTVKVYDGQKFLFSKLGTLVGHTGSSVSIIPVTSASKKTIHVYDSSGNFISSHLT